MRKILTTRSVRLLLALFCVFVGYTTALADVTVFVQASSAPKLYVFNASTSGTVTTESGTAYSSYTTWSGATLNKSVTTSDNKTWYYEVFYNMSSTSIILNNGSSQTADITSVSGTKYYYYNGESCYIDYTSLKSSLATDYCFFQNNSGFSTRYVYTYDSETEGSWPGKSFSTKVGHNSDGDIYYVPLSSSGASKIIFHNNNSDQSANLDYTKGNVYWYGQNSGGSFANTTVGAWPEVPTVVVDPEYYVYGNNSTVFGAEWAAASNDANKMTKSGSTYTWTSSQFSGIHGNLEFKVVQDGTTWYPSGDNLSEGVVEAGTYTLTVNFDPSTSAVTYTLNTITAPTAGYYLIGDFNDWDFSTKVAFTASGSDYTLSRTAFSGEFKIIDKQTDNYLGATADGEYYGINAEVPSATLTSTGKNLKIDTSGDYTFTISNGVLTVTGWPEPDWYIKTSENNWATISTEDGKLTKQSNGTYTGSITFASKTTGVTYFILTDQLGWTNINNGHRYAGTADGNTPVSPTTAGVTVNAVANTNSAENNYIFPIGLSGTYNFVYNPTAGTLTVSGAAPQPDVYLHRWSTGTHDSNGSVSQMTTSDYVTYTATVTLGKGENFIFSYDASGNWDDISRIGPANANEVLTASDSGSTAEGGSTVFSTSSTNGAGQWTITFNRTAGTWTATQNSVVTDPMYLLTWNKKSGDGAPTIADCSNQAFTTSDNVTYTLNGVVIGHDSYFVLATEQLTSWDQGDTRRYAYSGSDDQKVTAGSYTATAAADKAFYIEDYGTYNLSFNKSTGALTVTLVTPADIYIKGALTDWDASSASGLMSTSDNNVYTFTHTFATKTASELQFIVTDGHAATNVWDNINDGHRYANASDATITLGTAKTLESSADGVNLLLPRGLLGEYTFTYNRTTKQLTVTGNAAIVDIYLLSWSGSLDANRTSNQLTPDANQEVYTVSNVALNAGQYLIFSTNEADSWDDAERLAHYAEGEGATDQDVVSGTQYTATAGGNKAYKITVSGTWNFTYNRLTNQWTGTLASINPWYLKGDFIETDWEVRNQTTNKGQMTQSEGIFTFSVNVGSTLTTEPKYFILVDALSTSENENDAWTEINASHRFAGNDTDNHTVTLGTAMDVVQRGNNQNFMLPAGAKGEYQFSFNPVTKKLTVTGAAIITVEDWYLLSEFDGNAWDITNDDDHFTYNETTGKYELTRNLATVKDATCFILSKRVASSNDNNGWNELSGYRYNVGNSEQDHLEKTELSTAYNVTQWNDGAYYMERGYIGEYTFTLDPTANTLTITGPAKQDVWFLHGDFGDGNWHLADAADRMTVDNDGNYVITKTISQTGNTYFNLFKNVFGSNDSDWEAVNAGRYSGDNSESDDYTISIGVAQPVVLNPYKSYYWYVAAEGDYTFTYNPTANTLTVTGFDKNTGTMFLAGQAGTSYWGANVGMEMTEISNGVFQLDDVSINAGSTFTFTGALGSDGDDWDTFNLYRYFADSENACQVNTSDLGLVGDSDGTLFTMKTIGDTSAEGLNNFLMNVTGIYRVTFNTNTMKVNFQYMYPKLYMLGKFTYGNNRYGGDDFQPNSGMEMATTDGATYALYGVEFSASDGFLFSERLAEDNDQGGWDYIDPTIYASATAQADGHYTISDNSQINVALNLSNKGENQGQRFYLNEDMAGTYDVIVAVENGVAKTVTLRKSVTSEAVVNVYLEKNSAAGDNPGLIAFEIRQPDESTITGYSQHYTVSERSEAQTPDGISWWKWTVENGIADLLIYKNGDATNTANWMNDADNVKSPHEMIRRSGDIYLTWVVNEGNKYVEDHTREYYEEAVSESPTSAAVLDGQYYVYFVNTPGWDHVNIYAWGNDADGTRREGFHGGWDGTPCTKVGTYTENGETYDVYRFIFGPSSEWSQKTIDGIIFNCGNGHGVEPQTGDFVFHNGAVYDYCGVVQLGRELGTIIKNGVEDGPDYIIENDLVIVYYDPLEQAFYLKDLNRANEKSVNSTGKQDYIFDITHFSYNGTDYELLMKDRVRYDQSNWVKMSRATDFNQEVPEGKTGVDPWANPDAYLNKLVHGENITGQLLKKGSNAEFKAVHFYNDMVDYTYTPNDYITAHFNDSYVTGDGGPMYFVKPKSNEYAHITWAVYGGENEGWYEFFCPETGVTLENEQTGGMFDHGNAYGLTGGFRVKFDMLKDVDPELAARKLEVGQAYEFNAIIRYAETSTSDGARRRAQAVGYDKNYDLSGTMFEVYPVEVDLNEWVVTGIRDVNGNEAIKEVKEIRIYNTAGMQLNELQRGVNIIETIYTDGSRSTQKVLR